MRSTSLNRHDSTISGELHLDADAVVAEMRAIVRWRRHVVTHVNQSQETVRHLQHVDHGRRQQGRRHLVRVADHHPVPAHLVELGRVLKRYLVTHVLLRVRESKHANKVRVLRVDGLVVSLATQRKHERLHHVRTQGNVHRLREKGILGVP